MNKTDAKVFIDEHKSEAQTIMGASIMIGVSFFAGMKVGRLLTQRDIACFLLDNITSAMSNTSPE